MILNYLRLNKISEALAIFLISALLVNVEYISM